jgi:hydrogenase-4 component B
MRSINEPGLWAAGAIGAPALALIGALAVACFVKAYGAVFLGQARTGHTRDAHEPGLSMLMPMACLAAACAVIGLAPFAVAPALERAAATWAPQAMAAAPSLHVLAPLGVLSGTSMVLLMLLAVTGVLLLRDTRGSRSAAGPTWDCGYAAPSVRMQYTSSSFAETLVGFFSWALRPSVHAATPAGLFPRATQFHTHVPDTVLDRAVLPMSRQGARVLRWFRWVQHGNVHLYLVYVLAALVFLIAMGRW